MRSVLLSLMTALVAGASAPDLRAQEAPPRDALPRDAPPPARLHCMSTGEWRNQTSGLKLRDPFQCMRETAQHHQAEPLGARLCRLGELMLYEIKLLTQNGHVQRIFVDAVSGRPVPGVAEK